MNNQAKSDEKNVYSDDMLEALSIRKQCKYNNKIQIIHIQLKIGYKSYVKLFIKRIYGMSGPIQAHLYVKQINSSRFYFIGIVKLIICLEYLKIEILKIESLKLRFLK